MADLNITINPSPVISVGIGPPQSTSITIGDGIPPHNTSHSPAGLDSLETWYATVEDLNTLSGLLPSGIVYTSGDQNISGTKNFFSRPTINGTGVLLSGEAVTPNTGVLTGVFYPLNSNPSGYLTGVDLSGYVTIAYATGISGHLQGQITNLISGTGSFVVNSQTGQFVGTGSTGNFVTTGNTGNFVSSSQTGQLTGAFYPLSSNPAAYVQGAVVRPSNTGQFVDTSSVQTISGNKYFSGDVTIGLNNRSINFFGRTNSIVGGSGNLANGSHNFIGGGQSNTVSGHWSVSVGGISNYSSGTCAQTMGQANRAIGDYSVAFGSSNSATGFAASIPAGRGNRISGDGSFILGVSSRVIGNDSFAIGTNTDVSGANSFAIGRYAYADDPSAGIISVSENIVRSSGSGTLVINFDSGIYLNGPTIFNNRPTLNGTGFLLSGEVSTPSTGYLTGYVNKTETGNFYPSSNPSGYITGVDLSPYATTVFTTGISGHLQAQITTLNSATGSYVTTGQTGNFLTGVSSVDTIHLYGKNDESFAVYKGQPVYIGGANGANPLIKIASNTGESTSSKTIGLLNQNLNANDFGYIITEGILEGFDTSAASAGDPMWLGTSGNILFGTGSKPYGNNHLVYLGIVLRSNNSNGKVYVKPQNGFEIEELHRVYAKNANTKDALMYDSGSGSWFARQITTGDVSGISSYASNNSVVLLTGNQDVSDVKNFFSRPTVAGTGVLLSGESVTTQPNDANIVIGLSIFI